MPQSRNDLGHCLDCGFREVVLCDMVGCRSAIKRHCPLVTDFTDMKCHGVSLVLSVVSWDCDKNFCQYVPKSHFSSWFHTKRCAAFCWGIPLFDQSHGCWFFSLLVDNPFFAQAHSFLHFWTLLVCAIPINGHISHQSHW